jgi:L-iditol 2-dehydrogenase
MRLARERGGGEVAIVEEPTPCLPEGGLLVRTEACGLCSGELMDWYMDRKVPHVLGHEVAGIVVESDDERFPMGSRVFPHHHAPCLQCELCQKGLYVHCPQWKATKLGPGGMSEFFAVPPGNLNDTLVVSDLRSIDAALIEPLACVVKGIHSFPNQSAISNQRSAVIGLGVMGLMHVLMLPGSVAYELNPDRIAWARSLGLDARTPDEAEPADHIYVCPGNREALELALSIAEPGARILLFAPLPPGELVPLDLNKLYFKDISIVTSYSCGPEDTQRAAKAIREGKVRAEQVVSDFIALEDLPTAYRAMKSGKILKPMVVFS